MVTIASVKRTDACRRMVSRHLLEDSTD